MRDIAPVGTSAGPWVRLMLYAYPGWRKTSFIGTGPSAGYKTLIIRSPMDQIPARILRSGTEEYVAETWEDMMGGDGILDFLRMSDHDYQWVWVDCWSILQDVLLDDVWQAVIAEKPHRANLTPTGGLDKGEYGRNMERIQQFVRHLVGINNFHVGMTAHPVDDRHPTDDQGGTLLVPYIQGKNMTAKVCGYCNIVTFQELKTTNEQTWARMHFRENERFYAKDLYDAFPTGRLDNPEMDVFMSAIKAAQNGKPTTKPRRGAAARPQRGRRGKGAKT